MGDVSIYIKLILLTGLVCDCSAQTHSGWKPPPATWTAPPIPVNRPTSSCFVDNLPAPFDLNLNRIQGHWYATYFNQLWTDTAEILQRFPQTRQNNMQIHLNLTQNGDLTMKIATSVGATVCLFLEEKGTFVDRNYVPEEFEVNFRSLLLHTGWSSTFNIISTDYVDYLGLYTCKDVTVNGTCNTNNAYLLVLSRQPTPSPATSRMYRTLAESVCISGGSMKRMKQDGRCSFSPDKFPRPLFGIQTSKSILQHASDFMSYVMG